MLSSRVSIMPFSAISSIFIYLFCRFSCFFPRFIRSIKALSLRLYNPESHQWSLNFANVKGGAMAVPTIGEFKNGCGEFYNQETLNGRAIFVRFVISDITPNSCRFEQAFSDDGGKTWEVNWIATDTRVKDESDKNARNSAAITQTGNDD